MPMTAPALGSDSLRRLRTSALAGIAGATSPIPLASTTIDVTIRGGLAFVAIERAFRNAETETIDATIIFPVPLDATVCALSARIDGRTMRALALAHNDACTGDEEATDEGVAAVRHEEPIAGVHMLSIGGVRSGAEVVVSATWTAPLSFAQIDPHVRIPMTVSEIYGQSVLAGFDDPITDGSLPRATIAIACEDGAATLVGASQPAQGACQIALDAPIDIVITGWRKRALNGIGADGRAITLTIEPAPNVDDRLDIDLLFDRSGSMSESAAGQRELAATKFDAARVGLATLARHRLRDSDRVRLWQFNDSVRCVGEASGSELEMLLGEIDGADGGTEIGLALDHLIVNSRSRSVVIVTDAQSWALDPHRIARSGLRVTAVLIGEDALDGMVPAIAAMTGGQIFVAAGCDTAVAVMAACDAARMPHRPQPPIDALPRRLETFRRGARIVATWDDAPGAATTTTEGRLIGATAAMLAIPLMRPAAASALAAHEGIACHLTSIVLIDEVGEGQAQPVPRKIALPTPGVVPDGGQTGIDRARVLAGSSSRHSAIPRRVSNSPIGSSLPRSQPQREAEEAMLGIHEALEAEPSPTARSRSEGFYANAATRRRVDLPSLINLLLGTNPNGGGPAAPETVDAACVPSDATLTSPQRLDLRPLLGRIDWHCHAEDLCSGRIDLLESDMVDLIRRAAMVPTIAALARTWGIDAVVAVAGLLAQAEAGRNPSAMRVARRILEEAVASEVSIAMGEVGL
jgi:hypothetical protein